MDSLKIYRYQILKQPLIPMGKQLTKMYTLIYILALNYLRKDKDYKLSKVGNARDVRIKQLGIKNSPYIQQETC